MATSETPRARAKVPLPYQCCRAGAPSLDHDGAAMLQKLADFRAENQLLGRVLRQSHNEREDLERRLTDTESGRDRALAQLHASTSQNQRLQHELDAVRASLTAHQRTTHQAQQHISELEDLVLELNEKLATAQPPNKSGRLSTGAQAGKPAPQGPPWSPGGKSTRPGSPGPAYRKDSELRHQLQRLEELYESKLVMVRQEHEGQQRKLVQAMQGQLGELLGQLREEAHTQVAQAEAQLERQAADQTKILEQLSKRCALLEARLRDAQSNQGTSSDVSRLKMENTRLAAQVEALRVQVAKQTTDAGRQADQEVASQVKVREEAARAAVSAHQQQATSTLQRLTKMQSELTQAAADQHEAAATNAALSENQLALTEQLAAAENAIKVLRDEVAHLRARLLEAQTATLGELLQLAVDDVRKPSAALSPADTVAVAELRKGTGPVAIYVKVLEHALSECEARETSLRQAVNEAHYLESQSRALLQAARNEQVAGQRTLLQQIRRVQTLQGMRLRDAEELHRALAQQAPGCSN